MLDLGDDLALRPLAATDLDHLVALDADPEVMRYITGGAPITRAQYEAFFLERMLAPGRLDGRLGFFALEEAGRFVGWLHLRADSFEPTWLELGYRLRRDVWGRGLATRGSRALLASATTAFPGRPFSARTMPENTASRRVMEKLGFVYAGAFSFPARTIAGTEFPAVPGVLYRLDA